MVSKFRRRYVVVQYVVLQATGPLSRPGLERKPSHWPSEPTGPAEKTQSLQWGLNTELLNPLQFFFRRQRSDGAVVFGIFVFISSVCVAMCVR